MTLPDEAWPRVKEVFEGARALAVDARPAYLAVACGRDESLRQEVEALLVSYERAASFLETPAVLFDDAMSTKSLEGQCIGSYQLSARIGTGGMGEVYRAHDTKLNRHVAIKVLLPAVANDPDRLARFSREAQLLASLNHPHIAQIYGLDDAGGLRALVMELVEGPTLADRIAQGAIPIDEALPIAKQIAEALEAAHEHGIVHRDLKPANIKIGDDRTVKVLDFGLAKALDPTRGAGVDPVSSPAPAVLATEAHVILGTAAYMSPEQAKGRAVDKRTDIWAFGCVLYEMLTGGRPFPAENVPETLAAILMKEPDWAALPAKTPSPILRLLRRCLEKDRRERLPDITVARFDITDAQTSWTEQPVPSAAAASQPRAGWRYMAALGLALLAAGVLAIPTALHLRETPAADMPEIRTEIITPATTDPTSFALSPDGRQLVFVASGDGPSKLWLRPLAATSAQPLAGTEGAAYPFWSPDNRSVGFFADSKLKWLDIGGGQPVALTDAMARGGTWNADGAIVFARTVGSPLFRVSASGGAAVAVTKLDGVTSHRFPYFLPDGRHFLFYALGTPDTGGIHLGSLDSRETTRLTAADAAGVYLSSGWVAWIRAGTLVAQRLELARRILTGDTVTLADPVVFETGVFHSAVSVSATGLVAYRPGAASRRQLVWFDRLGKALGTVGAPDESGLSVPRLSPDDRRVVVYRTVQGNADVWLLDGARMSRFTFDAAFDRWPLWSPDGSQIVFDSIRKGTRSLYVKPSSGAGAEELLVESPQTKIASDWSADGRFLLYHSIDPQTNRDLWVLPLGGDRKPWAFLKTNFDERYAQFSPDGHWVAYTSNESGRDGIYVRPFEEPAPSAPKDSARTGRQWQVSTAGSIYPRWRHDGNELYYLGPDGQLMATPITTTGTTLEPGTPVALFHPRIVGGGVDNALGRQYDVARDGRFLINTVLDEAASPITLLQNWKPPTK